MKNLKSCFVNRKSYIFIKSYFVYLVLIAINYQLSTINCYAQSNNDKSESNIVHRKSYIVNHNDRLSPEQVKELQSLSIKKSSKSTHGRWYNYANAMQQSVQATNNFIAPRIFPDASVIVKYGDGGKLPPFIHAAAVVLDPTAEIFYDIEQSLNMTRLNKYRIDSIGLPCLYRRHIQDPEIVDTLVIEMISNIRGPYYSYTGMQSEFGYDTVWFCGLKRTNVNFNYLRPDASTEVIKRKIPLTAQTAADTLSSGINYIYFPSSQTNYYGKLCAFTFKFIPGYQWEKNDTLNLTLNEFMFFSYEEQGDNTYPYYTPGNYNSSQIVSSDNLNPNDSYYKAQLYCPSVAFAINYQGENHLVDFKLVSNNVEINEVRSLKSDVRIYPNPADEQTTISYELDNNSNVNMFIYDLTGKKVMELKQGKQTAGIHKININTSALSKGMYYYTLTKDNNSITRKMIIER